LIDIVLTNYRDPTDEKEKEEYGHVSFKLMLSFSMQVSHLFAKFFCSRWWNPTFAAAVLPADPYKPSLPLLAKTTATWGTFHGHQFFYHSVV
jgi:hypothetical protein